MKNLPSWIPNLNAWMSAILLLLLVRGMKVVLRAIFEHTDYQLLKLLSFNSHAVLYLVIVLFPIAVIAVAHHLLHIVLDLFAPDSQTPEMSGRKYWFPGLMSWWEGLYGWLAIALTMIITSVIGIIIFSPNYYLSEMSAWWLGSKSFFNPLMLLRLFCTAYLYQFEHLVRQHLITVGSRS
ncbi:MAG: hypothetical protein AAGF83_04630 [Cyanobacteria bacterium P01_G01_bin.67]